MLNMAGLPGKTSESSLFLFIYLVSLHRVQGQAVPAFWVILLPLGGQEDKLCKKMDFTYCGKVSVYRGKKMRSTFSPHDEFKIHVEINQKYP